MTERTISRLLWLFFLAAAVVLSFQFSDRLEGLFAGRGKLTVTDDAVRDTVTLHWRGGVEAPMHTRLSEAFREHRDKTRRFVVSLASPGGKLDHGGEVVQLIKTMQRTHSVDTVVEGRSVCASMCVPIYLAGTRRRASRQARFMFHEVSFRDGFTEEKSQVPEVAIRRSTDQLFERYFRPAGVSDAWIRSLRPLMQGRDVWRTAEELQAEQSGIVHEVN